MKTPVWLWVVLAVAVVATVVSYGNARAAGALADARRDALEAATEQAAERERDRHARDLRRDAERDSLATLLHASRAREDSLKGLLPALARASAANLARLRTILADSAIRPPDTVVQIVEVAVAGLETELRTCSAVRESCQVRAEAAEGLLVLRDSTLADRDSTLAEQSVLLTDYRTQLNAALRTSLFDAPVVRWGERLAAIYGIFEFLRHLLGAGTT